MLQLLKLLKSPITWVIIGVCALNIFVSSLLINNINLNHKNYDLKQQQTRYEQVIEAQKKSIIILEQDRVLLSNLEKNKQQVVVKQNNLNQKLNAIPKTSTDKPFTNPELLSAAEQLRAYQLANPESTTSSNNK
jgi:hypothetical protein